MLGITYAASSFGNSRSSRRRFGEFAVGSPASHPRIPVRGYDPSGDAAHWGGHLAASTEDRMADHSCTRHHLGIDCQPLRCTRLLGGSKD